MTISLFIRVSCFGFSLGAAESLESLLATIAYNLENRKWGSKYPIIMNDFYNGLIKKEQIEDALKELDTIESGLSKIKADQVVWVKCKELRHPSIVNNINQYATNLAVYFKNPDGVNMITLIRNALKKGLNRNRDVTIFKV